MDAYLFRRDATEGIIEHFHALLQMPAKLIDGSIGKTNVALHGQVRAIQLQREAGRNDSLILIAHSVREGVEIGFLGRIIVILHHLGDCPRRGSRHEDSFRLHFL